MSATIKYGTFNGWYNAFDGGPSATGEAYLYQQLIGR